MSSMIGFAWHWHAWCSLAFLQDCVCAVAFCVLFLIGSSVWADELTDIKHYSDPDELFNRIVSDCKEPTQNECKSVHGGNFATLNVSVVSCFLCLRKAALRIMTIMFHDSCRNELSIMFQKKICEALTTSNVGASVFNSRFKSIGHLSLSFCNFLQSWARHHDTYCELEYNHTLTLIMCD